jgi:cell division protein FtsW
MKFNPNMRTRQMPDKTLLLTIMSLLVFGWIMVFSASLSAHSSYLYFIKQTIFICMGLSAGLIMLNTPISVLQKYSIPLFLLTLVLLCIVFTPVGHEAKGSTRWINFVLFKFQPSELMKLSMVLFMAGFLVRQEKDLRKPWMGFLKTIAIIGITGFLILLETDIGATLIISLTAMAMLYAAGSYIKQLTIVTSGLFALVAIIVMIIPNRFERFISFWAEDFWLSDNSKLDQTKAALIGIARGDLFGVGIGAGIQKFTNRGSTNSLPERHTDMIFAVIGEELGFIGMMFVLLSFLFILLKGFSIAKVALQKGRQYSSYVVFGICTWFAMQITVNIGMNLGLYLLKALHCLC